MPVRIGRFFVLELLGAGGMGRVYAAYDPQLDRRIALKMVHESGHDGAHTEWRSRLIREAQAMARISDPHVVAVHDVGSHESAVFIAMELIEGSTLGHWLTVDDRPWPDIVAMFIGAGEGLDAAHRVGLVHRDFKPANVLVGQDGRPRVGDFGLARFGQDTLRTTHGEGEIWVQDLTVAGSVVGTPAYMAPEQLEAGTVDARTDVFAFAVALWEALFGVFPYPGGTVRERMAVARVCPPDPGQRAAEIPKWVTAVVARGLAYEPAARWPGMRPFLAALRADPDAERRRRWRQLGRGFGFLGLGAVLTIAGVVAVSQARTYARNAAADRVLDRTIAEIQALTDDGHHETASASFALFAAEPDHAQTPALARGYRWWAEQRLHQQDLDGALAAYVASYAEAPDPSDRHLALRGLAELYGRRGNWDNVHSVLETLVLQQPSTLQDDAMAMLAVQAATARLDLHAAASLSEQAPAGSQARAWAAVLAALAPATPVETPVHRMFPVELDGQAAVLLGHLDPSADSGWRWRLAAATPGLPSEQVLDFGSWVVFGAATVQGRPVLTLSTAHDNFHMISMAVAPWDRRGLGAVTEVSTGRPFAQAVADLDHNGLEELYLGAAGDTRQIFGLRPSATGWDRWSPHPPTNATASDINALLIDDFDGDGRDEILAAAGAWRAWDLRLFDHHLTDLTLLDRVKLGHIAKLARFDGPHGPEVLALKSSDQFWSAPEFFPDGDHCGAAAGLYRFRVKDRRLEWVGFEAITGGHGLTVTDLDGDGTDEILVSHNRGLSLFRADEDNQLDALYLRSVEVLGDFEGDGDPGRELAIRSDFGFWTFGAGTTAVPVFHGNERTNIAAMAPPQDLADDPLNHQRWQRGEELRALGLHRFAADRFVALADGVGQPELRSIALARAAQLRLVHDDDPQTVAQLFEAAASPGPAKWLRPAIDAYLQAGDLASGVRVAERLMQARGVDPELRLEAAALANRWRPLATQTPAIDLRFGRPLASNVVLVDPLMLRLDLIQGALNVTLTQEGSALEIPVRGGEQGNWILELDFTIDHLDYAMHVLFGIRGADRTAPAPIVEFGLAGGIEGGNLRVSAVGGRNQAGDAGVIDLAAVRGRPLRLRIAFLSSLGTAEVTLFDEDHTPLLTSRVSAELVDGFAPAVVVLEKIGAYAATAHLRLHRITARGVQPSLDRGQEAPLAAAMRAWVNARPGRVGPIGPIRAARRVRARGGPPPASARPATDWQLSSRCDGVGRAPRRPRPRFRIVRGDAAAVAGARTSICGCGPRSGRTGVCSALLAYLGRVAADKQRADPTTAGIAGRFPRP